jgi:hypothetical protein
MIGPPVEFVRVPNSVSKIACSVCGSTGYPEMLTRRGHWTEGHLRGHLPCARCGRMLSVTKHGTARTHGRCPVVTSPDKFSEPSTAESACVGPASDGGPHAEA